MTASTCRAALLAVAAALTVMPIPATAVTADNFLLRNAQDLADLCAVQPGDAQWTAAIHECQGFLAGAYQYYQALTSGRGQPPIFCVPTEGGPTRDQATRMFVEWARAHPQYMGERPVDTLVRWATEAWPCARAASRRPSR